MTEKIYTGYFAKLKKYQEEGLTPLSVARKSPEFYKGIECMALKPKKELFEQWKQGEITNEEYSIKYTQQLNNLDKKKIKEYLLGYAGSIVLLCWESPEKFCHRHVLADWLEYELGLICDERTVKEECQKD